MIAYFDGDYILDNDFLSSLEDQIFKLEFFILNNYKFIRLKIIDIFVFIFEDYIIFIYQLERNLKSN